MNNKQEIFYKSARALNERSYEFANRNYFAHDRQLHTTIMQNNFFSALPRLASRLYGV